MIPNQVIDSDLEVVMGVEATKTYKLSTAKIEGFTDQLEALQQAIYKELSTELYEYPIYSFFYGIDIESLIGKDPIYVQIELERRIIECLLKDDRIISVDSFRFTVTDDEILCECSAKSIYGEVAIKKGVNV